MALALGRLIIPSDADHLLAEGVVCRLILDMIPTLDGGQLIAVSQVRTRRTQKVDHGEPSSSRMTVRQNTRRPGDF